MKWRGQKVAVVGLGVSNVPLVRYLVGAGAEVVVCDQKTPKDLGPRLKQLAGLPVEYQLGKGYLIGLENFDTVFLSPGIPKDLPEIVHLRQVGVPISTEIEVFFELCPAPIIGITGSSGKTTTTTLIGRILVATGGRRVFVGGNIGNSLLDDVHIMTPHDVVVLELSSFQLELLPCSPHVALVTNVTANHLDVHKTMAAYIDAKRHIYAFQRDSDHAVFNYDDEITRSMAAECPSQVSYFSRTSESPRGAFLRDGLIVLRDVGFTEGTEEVICPIHSVRLLGIHNWENVLAAVTVSAVCGASRDAMIEVITSFEGVAHRLELVKEVDGVRFYNDSIATTPARAIAGIRAFSEPIVLIAGGYDKNLPFDEFAEAVLERVKAVVLIGVTAGKIESAIREKQRYLGGEITLVRASTFDAAVEKAKELANPGDVVLMSPACASYDMFRNFEERGNRFRELVTNFLKSK